MEVFSESRSQELFNGTNSISELANFVSPCSHQKLTFCINFVGQITNTDDLQGNVVYLPHVVRGRIDSILRHDSVADPDDQERVG